MSNQLTSLENIFSSNLAGSTIILNGAKEKAHHVNYILNSGYETNDKVSFTNKTGFTLRTSAGPETVNRIDVIDGNTVKVYTTNKEYFIRANFTADTSDKAQQLVSSFINSAKTGEILVSDDLGEGGVRRGDIIVDIADDKTLSMSEILLSTGSAKYAMGSSPVNFANMQRSLTSSIDAQRLNGRHIAKADNFSDSKYNKQNIKNKEQEKVKELINGPIIKKAVQVQGASRKEGTFNKRDYKTPSSLSVLNNKNDENYTIKIGDVVLNIPPTHITVCELRSSNSFEMIGFSSMSLPSYNVRIAFKINAVFTGRDIDDSLKRILTQFKLCPFNIIHSEDLYNMVIAENSWLRLSQEKSTGRNWVPVTMDEYTVYTIEGHPNTLGCSFQFSLFNYAAYFDGDLEEVMSYTKMEFDTNGFGIPPTKGLRTEHLEEAIHPYNFQIEDILKNPNNQFFFAESQSLLDDNLFTEEQLDQMSTASFYKLSSMVDMVENNYSESKESISTIDLMCKSIAVKYENRFGWAPVTSYSQAVPQYIGPGSTSITLNSHIHLDELSKNKKFLKIANLFKTYNESIEKDIFSYYDDRYFIDSCMTRLTDCLVCSIADVATTSMPNHPGYMDVNIVLRKSPYLSNLANNNKIAELDEYWGFNRIAKMIDRSPVIQELINKSLEQDRDQAYEEFGYLAKWNINSTGNTKLCEGVNTYLSQIINITTGTIEKTGTDVDKEIIKKLLLVDPIDITSTKRLRTYLESTTIDGVTFASIAKEDINLEDYSTKSLLKMSTDGSGLVAIAQAYNSGLLKQFKDIVTKSKIERVNIETKNLKIAEDMQRFIYGLVKDFKEIFNPSYVQVIDKFLSSVVIQGQTEISREMFDIYIDSNKGELAKLLDNILPPFKFFGIRKGISIFSDDIKTTKEAVMISISVQEGIKQEDIDSFYKKFKKASSEVNAGGYTASFIDSSPALIINLAAANSKIKRQLAKITTEKIGSKNPDVEKDINTFSFLSVPFAAHRYYPMVDSMVSTVGPSFSGTMGGWYYAKMKNDVNHISRTLEKYKDVVKNSISPLMDTEAYRNFFPKQSIAYKFYQKYEEDYTPTHLINALTTPSLRNNIDKDSFAANQKEGNGLGAMSTFSSISKSVLAFKDDETNRPFSGLNDFMFMSRFANGSAYGSNDIKKIQKIISGKLYNNNGDVVYNKPSSGAVISGEGIQTTLSQFDTNFFNQGVIAVDGKLDLRSATTPYMLTGLVPDKNSISYNLPKQHHYGSLFSYISMYRSAQSNTASVTPVNDTESVTPINPINGENKSTSLTGSDAGLVNFVNKIKSVLNTQTFEYLNNRDLLIKNLHGYLKLVNSNAKETYSDSAYSNVEEIVQAIMVAIYSFTGQNRVIFSGVSDFINKVHLYVDNNYNNINSFKYALISDKNKFRTVGRNGKNIYILSAIYEYVLYSLMIAELDAISKSDNLKNKTKFKTPFMNRPNFISVLFGEITSNYENFKEGMNPSVDSIVRNGVVQTIFNGARGKSGGDLKERSLLTLVYPIIDSSDKVSDMLKIKQSLMAGCANIEFDKLTVEDLAAAMKEELYNQASSSEFLKSIREAVPSESDDHTNTFMVNQILDSMLPTIGLENAFPTYKLYIIDSGLSDIRFYSMDNWYDFRLVQDMMVIKGKEAPAHILKCRVLVDERFITTNLLVPQRDSDRQPIESKNQNATYQIINTKNDHMFYQGKVPLRAGMRVCLKLGYHTDPRMLDTVFIGTITGIGETMQKGMFELEALGDGRELSTPATNGQSSIEGENYGDIISKMLRANPAVVHFGKNYGSTIERWTREHLIMYGLCSASVKGYINSNLWPAIIGAAIGKTAGTALAAKSTIGAVFARSSLGAAIGAGAVASGIFLYNTYGEANKKNIGVKIGEEIKEKASAAIQKNDITGNVTNIRKFINGHTFDLSKGIGQVWKHIYDTYKSGHDPIDDNIWAVDIWNSLTNLGKGEDLIVNNTRSAWDVMLDIKRLYPNYAMDVRPYGSRSTLYFGPTNWLMWRTDDPVLAMMPQIEETSNESIVDNMGNHFKALYEQNSLGNKSNKPDSAFASLTSFQKTHLATSDGNIIMNGIKSTPERGWNAVLINNAKGATFPLVANSEIHPGAIRQKQFTLAWTNDDAKCLQYALGCLKEGVEKMYGGTLVLRGNPKIEPYDRVYIADKINKMYGWIEVGTVIHKFDSNFGFTTHIEPNMLCAINSDAYKTDSQIMRSLATSDLMAATLSSFISGLAGGVLISGAVAAAGITGVALAAVQAIGAIFFGYSLLETAATIKGAVNKMQNNALGTQNTRIEDSDIMEALEASHRASFEAAALNSGLFYGFAVGTLLKIAKSKNLNWEGAKVFGAGTRDTIKSGFAKTYGWAMKIADKNLAIASTGMTSLGRGNTAAESYLEKMKSEVNKFHEALGKEGIGNTKIENPAEMVKAIDETDLSKVTDEKTKKILEKTKTNIKRLGDAIKVASSREAGVVDTFSGKKINQYPESVKGPSGKFVRSGMSLMGVQMLLSGLEAVPAILETFMLNNITRGNSITIYPLWSKNSLMIAGLDGWQSTNVFMHARNFITNARRIYSDIDRSVLYNLPTLRNNPIITSDQLKAYQKAQEYGGKAVAVVAKPTSDQVYSNVSRFRQQAREAIAKHKYKFDKVNCPEAKRIFNENTILAIIDQESKGNPTANAWKGYNGVVSEGFGLMQLTPSVADYVVKELPADKKDLFDPNKMTLNSKDRQEFTSAVTLNPEININAGTAYFAECILGEIKKGGCDQTLLSRALAAYNGGPEWRSSWINSDGTKKNDPSGLKRKKADIIEEYKTIIPPKVARYEAGQNDTVTNINIKNITPFTNVKNLLNMDGDIKTGKGVNTQYGIAITEGLTGIATSDFKTQNPFRDISLINKDSVVAIKDEKGNISFMRVISKTNDVLAIGESNNPIKVSISKNENAFVKLDNLGRPKEKIIIQGVLRGMS